MTTGDEDICERVRAQVTSAGILDSESEIQHATKFGVKSGANRAGILVFNTGRIHVEGAQTELKDWCTQLKNSIESGTAAPGIVLPAEIENLSQVLAEGTQKGTGIIRGSLVASPVNVSCSVRTSTLRLLLFKRRF